LRSGASSQVDLPGAALRELAVAHFPELERVGEVDASIGAFLNRRCGVIMQSVDGTATNIGPRAEELDAEEALVDLDDRGQRRLKNETRGRKVISNPALHRLQLQHFILFDVIPALGTLLALALLAFAEVPFGWFEVALFVGMWWLTGMSITVGYHRLFTHRSFKAKRWVEMALAIGGAMAGQGSYVSWAAIHRRHHELSDREGDPHSPNLHARRARGLWHAHLTWMQRHEYPSVVHYTPDLLGDPAMMRIDRHYKLWVAIGLAVPTLLGLGYHGTLTGGLQGLLWGGALRMFFLEHTIWAINSFLHCFGRRDFKTRDESRNSHLFALLTFGEAWHNNHHAFPGSAWFSLSVWKFDPAYVFICLLRAAGLAWDVKVPKPAQIEGKRLTRKFAS
jgi:stearoyl-CoA desaturase (Delta-9 desaturase)